MTGPARPERRDRSDGSERLDQSDELDLPAGSDRPEPPERSHDAERRDPGERLDPAGRPDPPERRPLPTDASTLPPLGPAFDDELSRGLATLGVSLSRGSRAAIDAHARLLMAWNEAINLTALRTPEQVARLHVLDSLTALRLLADERVRLRGRAPTLLDLGSGGGYPGLPLAVALPVARAALVDSVGKKARFLAAVAAAAWAAMRAEEEDPPVLESLPERAEDLAQEPDHRDAWDVVTARAVGSLAEVAELSFPLLRPGGRLVCWKTRGAPGSLEAELAEARGTVLAVGGDRPRIHAVALPGLPGHVLVEIPKVRETPWRFPRSPAERRRALLR